MKFLIKTFLFICFAFNINFLFAENNNIVQATNSKPNFLIKIKSNPSTGYKWYIKDYDRNLLYLTKHDYVAPKKEGGLVGAAGEEQWGFRLAPGANNASYVTEVTLVYMRPWDIKSMQETKYYIVVN